VIALVLGLIVIVAVMVVLVAVMMVTMMGVTRPVIVMGMHKEAGVDTGWCRKGHADRGRNCKTERHRPNEGGAASA